jgi:hypothetical protein
MGIPASRGVRFSGDCASTGVPGFVAILARRLRVPDLHHSAVADLATIPVPRQVADVFPGAALRHAIELCGGTRN